MAAIMMEDKTDIMQNLVSTDDLDKLFAQIDELVEENDE